jgi:hypothetical protein
MNSLLLSKQLESGKLALDGLKITTNDILQRSWLKNKKRWRNNNRLRKKFVQRWTHYVSYKVYAEIMGILLTAALRHRLNYDEMGRMAVKVEPLPKGALLINPPKGALLIDSTVR